MEPDLVATISGWVFAISTIAMAAAFVLVIAYIVVTETRRRSRARQADERMRREDLRRQDLRREDPRREDDARSGG